MNSTRLKFEVDDLYCIHYGNSIKDVRISRIEGDYIEYSLDILGTYAEHSVNFENRIIRKIGKVKRFLGFPISITP